MTDWHDQAVCKTVDPEMWFPDGGLNNKWNKAYRICASCPVQQECLTESLENGEEYGIWGGVSAGVRQRLLPKYRRSNPAKRTSMVNKLLDDLHDMIEKNQQQLDETRESQMLRRQQGRAA